MWKKHKSGPVGSRPQEKLRQQDQCTVPVDVAEHLDELKVTQLRDLCRGRDISMSGTKKEIIDRLRRYAEETKQSENDTKRIWADRSVLGYPSPHEVGRLNRCPTWRPRECPIRFPIGVLTSHCFFKLGIESNVHLDIHMDAQLDIQSGAQ
jgi:hypothetical protein